MQLAYTGTTLATKKDKIKRIMNIITDNSHADYNAGNEKIFAISVLSKII
jgi:hypothetical protein